MKEKSKKRIRKPTNITLDPAIVEQARALAESQNRKLSNLIETLIMEALAKAKKRKQGPPSAP